MKTFKEYLAEKTLTEKCMCKGTCKDDCKCKGKCKGDCKCKCEGALEEKNWIKSAVTPKHAGFCSPTTKATCTPHRKALAMRFKKGDLHKDKK